MDWSRFRAELNPRALARGREVATRLFAAATERAFALGAAVVEGYPVVPRDASRRMPGVFAWTGVPAVFEASGYEPLPRPAGLRPVYVASPARRPGR